MATSPGCSIVPPKVYVSFVVLLICFLAYSPQPTLLFEHTTPRQRLTFNLLLACLWASYIQACRVPAGSPPKGWIPDEIALGEKQGQGKNKGEEDTQWSIGGDRWCRKCEGWKPRRAHHCRQCGVCVLKMDHHCPWTANCVGYGNSGHFVRFLGYCVASMVYLVRILVPVFLGLWEDRKASFPIRGFGVAELVHLFVLTPVLLITLFALTVLLIRFTASLATNTTTIEGWENEKYQSDLRRRRRETGMLLQAQVFPYDIGLWENMCEALGPRWWGWWYIFSAGGPPIWRGEKDWDWEKNGGGIRWKVNGFDPPHLNWPPKEEGEKIVRRTVGVPEDWDGEEVIDREKFEERRRRWAGKGAAADEWRNSEGERLADFGVDEEVYVAEMQEEDDEDVPLGEILRRRRARAAVVEN